jgi:hypothetical protein
MNPSELEKYHALGPNQRRAARMLMATGFPFVVVWVFCATMGKEIIRAYRYAWLEAQIEIEDFHKHWQKMR